MSPVALETVPDSILMLDSGSLAEVGAAVDEGLVEGLTTNPTLTARGLDLDGEGHDTAALLSQAHALIDLAPGLVFVQPFSFDPDEVLRQARLLGGHDPRRVVIKLHAGGGLLAVARTLHGEGIRTAMTAVFAPAQALVAHEVGCGWVIPYVDRAARHGSGADTTVGALAGVLAPLPDPPRILAASIKSPAQAAEAVRHGCGAISAPLAVLREMAEHPLSRAAREQFDLDLGAFRSAGSSRRGSAAPRRPDPSA